MNKDEEQCLKGWVDMALRVCFKVVIPVEQDAVALAEYFRNV
jgi:hypothetical protein